MYNTANIYMSGSGNLSIDHSTISSSSNNGIWLNTTTGVTSHIMFFSIL